MLVDAPARWLGREKEVLALIWGEAARHLGLDAIDQSLRIGKRLPQSRCPVARGGQDAATNEVAGFEEDDAASALGECSRQPSSSCSRMAAK